MLATQNPIEMEGTYPLPEAQLDRFLLKAVVGFPTLDVLRSIGFFDDRHRLDRSPIRATTRDESLDDAAARCGRLSSRHTLADVTAAYITHGDAPRAQVMAPRA